MGFNEISGKPSKVLELDHHRADPAYFTFFSVDSAVAIDNRAPGKSLSLEFSLRLSQILAPSCNFLLSFKRHNSAAPSTKSQSFSDFDTQIGGFTDTSFDKLGVMELRALLAGAYTTIFLLVPTPPSLEIQPSNLISSPTLVSAPTATF